MNELAIRKKCEYTHLGTLINTELLSQPWGYYDFLGISIDASPEEIKSAFRDLSKKMHIDIKGEDSEAKKKLTEISSVLRDNGKGLGSEHSRKTHYDKISALNYWFNGCTECIEYNGDTTDTISNIMLTRLRDNKIRAEVGKDIIERAPELVRLKEDYTIASKKYNKTEAEKLAQKIQKIIMSLQNLTEEEITDANKKSSEARSQHMSKQLKFTNKFKYSCESYFNKIVDIFYPERGNIVFGKNRYGMSFEIISHENRENILSLIIAHDSYISGFSKVHFKAPQANVTIEDPNVKGIFHIIDGAVNVKYEQNKYYGVIRVKAPFVYNFSGFVQKGDLFTPVECAHGEWWKNKPSVEIVAVNGSVNLQITIPEQYFNRTRFLDTLTQDYKYNRFEPSSKNSLESLVEKFNNMNDTPYKKNK